MNHETRRFRKKPLAAAIGALTVPVMTVAVIPQAAANEAVIEELIVTASRRSESIQDVPVNIAAVTGADIEEQGLTDLAEIAAWIPGLHIVDQGARGADRIVVRGLNADPLAASEGIENDGGGIVATYIGEIPMYVDLKLNDMSRVEVLLGPQGTLYGAGTMGGAIRYIPNKPEFDATTFSARGDVFKYSESKDPGTDVGFTFNHSFLDNLALRVNLDYLDDPGFIDYDYLVREIGVSNPDPAPADRDANLFRKKDANDEQTTSGRVALRWMPVDAVDATLTYYYQKSDTGGRTMDHHDALGVDKYVSALRVLEPSDRKNQLLSLEVTADLGFAELTSATGLTSYDENGHRDQTDLLIGLEYSYEAFPSFTSRTQEEESDDGFNQELRLVSTGASPFSWIIGGFYNDFDGSNSSKEFTPGYDTFAVNEFGGVWERPDSLEYYSVSKKKLTEKAVFGEASYQLTDAWQITVGARWYDYKLKTRDAVDFPLYYTVFEGAPQDQIILEFEDGGQDDNGVLFKFNTSYHFTDDLMAYATVSEGYRIGNSNGVAPCPDPLPDNQIACALPNEVQYFPDKTVNYELGVHSSWADDTLTLNGAVYYIDWTDPQVSSATENALIPITINGDGAKSVGVELAFNWLINDHWSARGSFTHNESELTDPVPNLIPRINPPGFQSTITYEDGEKGDRLPGSPENQGSIFITYTRGLGNGMLLDLNYGMYGVSNVLTRTGNRGGGDKLSGYVIQNVAATLSREVWSLTLYVDNLADKYAVTAARSTSDYVQTVSDINGDPVQQRSYFRNVLPPRQMGLRMAWHFGG